MAVWLTKLAPDLRHRQVRTELGNAVTLHQRLMSLVPHVQVDNGTARQAAGLLFRLEPHRTDPLLLVQSLVEPDLSRLPAGYRLEGTGRLDRLLDSLTPGVVVRYRIAANPIRKRPRGSDRPGQRIALHGPHATRWWQRRAAKAGLRLHAVRATAQPDILGTRHRPDVSATIKHAVTRFDGLAVIHDPDRVRDAVRAGIGTAKAHGCGLLSLLPPPYDGGS